MRWLRGKGFRGAGKGRVFCFAEASQNGALGALGEKGGEVRGGSVGRAGRLFVSGLKSRNNERPL